ncbi:MAG: CRISPR system precrRNA processing endoribonuclease RAMP protein Cas6 [Lachnospiraceae bacterium]|nr:CRISPR system precrRNA processing endoribonuclease RAMP protein Cas6 [Lachnospiraceae bacterium]
MDINLKEYEKYLDIPYVKLHFTVRMKEDCHLPRSKTSALRGGTGQMLILQNCIHFQTALRDEDCAGCNCREECLVQRFLYTPMVVQPSFSADKLSMGYLFECENYHETFYAGDTFEFNVILFGKSRVYLNLLLQAMWALGQRGLGKDKGRFEIVRILNSRKEDILVSSSYGMQILKEKYLPETLSSYVLFRMKQLQKIGCSNVIKFQTETALKYQKKMITEFNMEAIAVNLARKIYLFNCFEGTDAGREMAFEDFSKALTARLPRIQYQKIVPIQVKRFSSRQMSSMWLEGIRGEVRLDHIPDEMLPYLLAGEIMHIGKNTSFGFGRYRIF